MKIFYLTHTLNPRTGAGEFSANLIDGVRQNDANSHFTVMTSEDYLRASWPRLLMSLPKIRRQIIKSDLVHALDAYPYGLIAYLASYGLARPIIITVVGSGSLGPLYRGGWRSWLLHRVFKKVTRVIAISSYIKRELEKHVPGLNVSVITHGVDSNFWSKQEPENSDAVVYPRQPYVLTVGEFKKRKGYLLILPLIGELKKQIPDLNYVIIANPNRNHEFQREIRSSIERLHLDNTVTFLNNLTREQLRVIYQRAQAFLLLPQNINGDVEGFGLVLLEAAAAGTPSVLGSGSGADDAVYGGQSGFVVPTEDKRVLLSLLYKLVKDGVFRSKMSKTSRDWAISMDWKHKIKEYLKVYEEIQG